MKHLQTEWSMLQGQIDIYEVWSLVIKLCNVVVLLLSIIFSISLLIASAILLVVWLQDAIWKTFQTRSEQRLLIVEQAISDEKRGNASDFVPMQLASEFEANRGSTISLFVEYGKQAIRPTVAFPHVILIFIFIASVTGG